MIAGSLFSGIEGFGLGLIWSGLVERIAFQVEIDHFCRRVLEARFPNVDRSITDVRAASASVLSAVELLFGGFPCQDLSGAGKGAGLEGERSGLWFEGLRVVAELEPRVVLFENVASGARRWVCPVRGGLEALGYRTRAYHIGVDDCGGPHRRKRLFVLAYANRGREPQREGGFVGERGRAFNGGQEMADSDGARWGEGIDEARGGGARRPAPESGGQALADPERGGRDERAWSCGVGAGLAEPAHGDPMANAASPRREGPDGAPKPGQDGAIDPGRSGRQDEGRAQSAVGARADGFPPRVVRWPAGPGAAQAKWEPPRVLASVEERAAKLKAIGNAVSPIQAYHVGRWAREVLRV